MKVCLCLFQVWKCSVYICIILLLFFHSCFLCNSRLKLWFFLIINFWVWDNNIDYNLIIWGSRNCPFLFYLHWHLESLQYFVNISDIQYSDLTRPVCSMFFLHTWCDKLKDKPSKKHFYNGLCWRLPPEHLSWPSWCHAL